MILDHYGFRTDPFNPDPVADPYLGSVHSGALAGLYYHLEQGEKVPVLVGPNGVGKTTLLRLMEKSERTHKRTLLLAPSPSNDCELLREILPALGIFSIRQDVSAMCAQLRDVMACDADGRNSVTIFLDDAQNLDDSGLNLIRSLSALAMCEKKPFSLVLAGSIDLENRLSSTALGGIMERVPLAAIAPGEIDAYINHRLRMTGWTGKTIFLADACAAIGAWTDGVPGRVNEFCTAALRKAAMHNVQPIDAAWLQANVNTASAAGSQGAARLESFATRLTIASTCVTILIIVFAAAVFYILRHQFGNMRAAGSNLGASRTIDRNVQAGPGVGVSAHKPIKVGQAKTRMIQPSSPQPRPPLSQANPPSVEATPNPPPSKVLFSVPYANSVQSFAGSHNALEQNGVAQPSERDSSTIAHSTQSSRGTSVGNQVGAVPATSIDGPLLSTPYVPSPPRSSTAIAVLTNVEKASDQIEIGDAYMRLRDYSQALARYQNALAITPDSKEVQQRISKAAAAEGAKASALINREKTSVAIRRGDAYELTGNYDKAISSFEDALKFTPGSSESRERLKRAIRAKAAEDAVLR